MSMRVTPGRLAAAAALAVPLLCTAAQGTPALAATTTKTPTVTSAISQCSPIYSVGHRTSSNTETWSYIGSDTRLYFYGSGIRTSICGAGDGTIRVQSNPGLCLQPTSDSHVQTASCNGSSAQQWEILSTDSTNFYVFALENLGNPYQCLYDYVQEPAILTSCSQEATDHFEWFYWPIG
jgi:hypothetical protein